MYPESLKCRVLHLDFVSSVTFCRVGWYILVTDSKLLILAFNLTFQHVDVFFGIFDVLTDE